MREARRRRHHVRQVEEDHARAGERRVRGRVERRRERQRRRRPDRGDRRAAGAATRACSAAIPAARRRARSVHHARGRGHARQPAQVVREHDADPEQHARRTPGSTWRHEPGEARWRPGARASARSGIASTNDATITQPSSARHQHRAEDAARHVARGLHGLLGRVRRGVEAGDRVDRPASAPSSEHQPAGPRAAGQTPPPGVAAVVGERDQPRDVEVRRGCQSMPASAATATTRIR